ncbi:hypothetical protein [Demequina capsici]|uniref:Restriction endonuclease n=1 Tax=Demequina capsici TaxID=3075620 RepID=A0AA96J710_9MICO|nr:hypothetical protein [Demequina sp. OYTSA14]WNM23518.1 hypothetical protein RN606_09065 [Demequina sp. OYTSA14]
MSSALWGLAVNKWQRLLVAALAVSLVAGGAAALILKDAEVAATAFVLAGLLMGLLAVRGIWPTSLSVGSSSLEWAVKEVDAAAASTADPAASQVLENLADSLRLQNIAPKTNDVHPAQRFDDELARELERFGIVSRNRAAGSGAGVDFTLITQRSTIFIESKWLRPSHGTFNGSTIQQVVSRLPPASKILVVVNTTEEESRNAARRLRRAPGTNSTVEVVGWRGPWDTSRLANAIDRLESGDLED